MKVKVMKDDEVKALSEKTVYYPCESVAIGIWGARERTKMSVAEISRRSGISRRRIQQMERGQAKDLKLTEVHRVMMALGGYVMEIYHSDHIPSIQTKMVPYRLPPDSPRNV